MSSTMAMVTSNSLIEAGAWRPRMASTPMAKAMSVAAGIAQPRSKLRVEAGDGEIDQGGHRHSGGGGDDRQPPLGGAGEAAFDPFALHLEPDEQEENRHRPSAIHWWMLICRAAAAPGRSAVQDMMIVVGERRIGEQQRQRRGRQQQQPGALFHRLVGRAALLLIGSL